MLSFIGLHSPHPPLLVACGEDRSVQLVFSQNFRSCFVVSSHYESGHRRSRRSTATKVICQLALRADHSFFVQMGRSEEQAIKYIVSKEREEVITISFGM